MVTYDLPEELAVEVHGPIRTVVINRPAAALQGTRRVVGMYLSQALTGAVRAGFAAEVTTTRSGEHRDRLLAVRRKER